MKSTKATEEIFKAKVHLVKAKKVLSNYVFENQTSSLVLINKAIDDLEKLELIANADSKNVAGSIDPRTLTDERISSKKWK